MYILVEQEASVARASAWAEQIGATLLRNWDDVADQLPKKVNLKTPSASIFEYGNPTPFDLHLANMMGFPLPGFETMELQSTLENNCDFFAEALNELAFYSLQEEENMTAFSMPSSFDMLSDGDSFDDHCLDWNCSEADPALCECQDNELAMRNDPILISPPPGLEDVVPL